MKKSLITLIISVFIACGAAAGNETVSSQAGNIVNNGQPFCFWYWMYGAVSKPAIKADLETMKRVGLRGTYLMPIRGVDEKPEYEGKAQQLTPGFWDMVQYSLHIADSLGLEIGVHICDGFALAGGPWFTPEESMQKVVWTEQLISLPKASKRKKLAPITLPQPKGDGYKDIAVYAIPVTSTVDEVKPLGMTHTDAVTSNEKNIVMANEPCSFTYEFPAGVTVSAVEISPSGTNIQCQRLKVEYSTDGKTFLPLTTFTPARQGWQNTAAATTFALPILSLPSWGGQEGLGLFLRFSWTPEGTEPGSEDLDAAKWKPTLRLKNIRFFQQPRIHQWEGKAAYAWRVADETTDAQIPAALCTPLDKVIRLPFNADGSIDLSSLPKEACAYRLLRMGHCTTGQTNATAGGGKGLECDKFSKAAVNKLVDNWFAKFYEIAKKTSTPADSSFFILNSSLKYLHVDSWECGCQNWNSTFAAEFMARRGYDLMPYLPLFVGYPLVSAAESERVLRDVRVTINELINDNFFTTLRDRAHQMGMQFSSESIAPTMVSDGLDHYAYADLPMGEYWLNSPTHDKPNDMFDAISGAHIYGKNIVQAEGFTEVRGVWDETPASIKTLLDRNFALGMNRLFFHVNTHNPWMDRKPGMTLDGIGLFFQRDQIWMPEARPFVDYVTRCSTLLQLGRPVQDIGVYIGDEMPRRSILPERLVPMLPGIFGKERVASEQARLANVGQPMQESPVGVNHSAGIVDTKDWINALRGYQYDSFNPDVLLNHATARDGKMVLDGGAQYRVVVIPQARPMNPNNIISAKAQAKIDELRKAGVVVVDKPYTADDFSQHGLERDVVLPKDIAYTHRTADGIAIYFLSNQKAEPVEFDAMFRDSQEFAYIYDPVRNTLSDPIENISSDSSFFTLHSSLPANGSCFVLFTCGCINAIVDCLPELPAPYKEPGQLLQLSGPYTLTLKEANYTTKLDSLISWTELPTENLSPSGESERGINYFSGHGLYTTTLKLKKKPMGNERLDLGTVHDIAHVWVNGIDCGIIWTAPYEAHIGHALKRGDNKIEIEVVNTWANAIRGMDEGKAPYPGIWTNARYRMKQPYLLPAGLLK